MKKITKEQFNQMRRHSRLSEVTDAIKGLKQGEALYYSMSEFADTGIKTPFVAYIHQYFRRPRTTIKLKVCLNMDRTGWVILRVL